MDFADQEQDDIAESLQWAGCRARQLIVGNSLQEGNLYLGSPGASPWCVDEPAVKFYDSLLTLVKSDFSMRTSDLSLTRYVSWLLKDVPKLAKGQASGWQMIRLLVECVIEDLAYRLPGEKLELLQNEWRMVCAYVGNGSKLGCVDSSVRRCATTFDSELTTALCEITKGEGPGGGVEPVKYGRFEVFEGEHRIKLYSPLDGKFLEEYQISDKPWPAVLLMLRQYVDYREGKTAVPWLKSKQLKVDTPNLNPHNNSGMAKFHDEHIVVLKRKAGEPRDLGDRWMIIPDVAWGVLTKWGGDTYVAKNVTDEREIRRLVKGRATELFG